MNTRNMSASENQVRKLVADLVEGMWAQQRHVIGINNASSNTDRRRRGLRDTAPTLMEDQNARRERENGRYGMVPSPNENLLLMPFIDTRPDLTRDLL